MKTRCDEYWYGLWQGKWEIHFVRIHSSVFNNQLNINSHECQCNHIQVILTDDAFNILHLTLILFSNIWFTCILDTIISLTTLLFKVLQIKTSKTRWLSETVKYLPWYMNIWEVIYLYCFKQKGLSKNLIIWWDEAIANVKDFFQSNK